MIQNEIEVDRCLDLHRLSIHRYRLISVLADGFERRIIEQFSSGKHYVGLPYFAVLADSCIDGHYSLHPPQLGFPRISDERVIDKFGGFDVGIAFDIWIPSVQVFWRYRDSRYRRPVLFKRLQTLN